MESEVIGNELPELIEAIEIAIVTTSLSVDEIKKCLPVMGTLSDRGARPLRVLNVTKNCLERGMDSIPLTT